MIQDLSSYNFIGNLSNTAKSRLNRTTAAYFFEKYFKIYNSWVQITIILSFLYGSWSINIFLDAWR